MKTDLATEKRQITTIRARPSIMQKSRKAADKRKMKHVDWMEEAILANLQPDTRKTATR